MLLQYYCRVSTPVLFLAVDVFQLTASTRAPLTLSHLSSSASGLRLLLFTFQQAMLAPYGKVRPGRLFSTLAELSALSQLRLDGDGDSGVQQPEVATWSSIAQRSFRRSAFTALRL